MAFLSVSLVVSVLVLAKSDCDLILAWYSRWGKNPDKVLNGKVIWITGASSGIGENLSYVLAKTGAQLILSARREEELNRVLERCKGEKFVIWNAQFELRLYGSVRLVLVCTNEISVVM